MARSSQEVFEYACIAYDDESGEDVRFRIKEIETTVGKGHRQRKFSSFFAQPASLGFAQPKQEGVHVVPLGELPENWKMMVEMDMASEKARAAERKKEFINRYKMEQGDAPHPSLIPDFKPDYSDIWIRMPHMHIPKRRYSLI